MGARTTLQSLATNSGDLVQAFTAGDDLQGNLGLIEMTLYEAILDLTRIEAIMTAAGDTANASTIAALIVALS